MSIFIPKMKFLRIYVCTGQHIKEKYQNGCHLTAISWNEYRSNQCILGAHVYIHTKYEFSMTIYVGMRANKKIQNGCHLNTVSQNN